MDASIYSQIEHLERNGIFFDCEQFYTVDADGNDYVDGDQIDKNLLLRIDAYRKAAGLLTSQEIRAIRNYYHLSQKDFASILGIGIIDVARYETKAIQTRAINDILLRAKQDPIWFFDRFKNSSCKLSQEKAKQSEKAIVDAADSPDALAIYSESCLKARYLKYREKSSLNGKKDLDMKSIGSIVSLAQHKIPSLYKTKLAKILFYCDFVSYREQGCGITGLVYRHAPRGAMPEAYENVLGFPMFEVKERVVCLQGQECVSYIVSTKQENILSDVETSIVNRVLSLLCQKRTTELSEYNHSEDAYTQTKDGEIIDYRFSASLSI